MNEKKNRNRPVFRPQGDDTETALESAATEEETPRVEETEDVEEDTALPDQKSALPDKFRSSDREVDGSAQKASWSGKKPAETPPETRPSSAETSRPDRTSRPEKEEPPATIAPTARSAFASAGGGTRGRLRTISDTGAPGSPADRDRSRDRDRERDRERDRSREGDSGRERDRTSPAPASRTPAPAPGTGGDTVPVMRSIDYDPSRARTGRNAPPGRAPQRPGGGGRSTQLPKPRRHTASTPGRFGFFGFAFGLVGLVIRMLIVTVLVGGVVGVASYFIIQAYVKTPPVLVPNVRGMRIQEAFDTLSAKRLAMIQERSEPSALVAPGEVIEQRPGPGINTKQGTTVRLVVSSGKSNFVVPDVRGETRDTAVNKIKGAQLEVGNITFLPDDKVAKDSVITQNPEPNKGLEQAVKVDLLISSGAPGSSLTMPDVTNVTVSEARSRLSRLGISEVAVDPPDAAASATVTGQDPLVGKMILQSQKVTLQTGR